MRRVLEFDIGCVGQALDEIACRRGRHDTVAGGAHHQQWRADLFREPRTLGPAQRLERGAEPAECRTVDAQERLRLQELAVALEPSAIRGDEVSLEGKVQRVAAFDRVDELGRRPPHVEEEGHGLGELRRILSGLYAEHRRGEHGARETPLMLVDEAQQDVRSHRMGKRDHRQRRAPLRDLILLDRFDTLHDDRADVCVILIEARDVAGAVAAPPPLGRPLAAPVETDHDQSARGEVLRRLVILLEELGQAVQQKADAARRHAVRQVPNGRTQLALIRRDQRLDAKAGGHGFIRK